METKIGKIMTQKRLPVISRQPGAFSNFGMYKERGVIIFYPVPEEEEVVVVVYLVQFLHV